MCCGVYRRRVLEYTYGVLWSVHTACCGILDTHILMYIHTRITNLCVFFCHCFKSSEHNSLMKER